MYGAIGYSILENNKHKLLIFSDRHDNLRDCHGPHYEISNIIDYTSDDNKVIVMLEEVDRTKRTEYIKLLFPSPHTTALKNVFINNPDDIIGVDIRPFLITFSLSFENKLIDTTTLYDYFNEIDKFYSLKLDLLNVDLSKNIKNDLGDIYSYNKLKDTQLGQHFLDIKKQCINFINKNKKNLYNNFKSFLNNDIIEDINNILSDIMEWYMCAIIIKNENKPFLIHAGLAHTTQIIDYLTDLYKYNITKNIGITHMNNLNEHNNNGCIDISTDILKELNIKY